MIAKVLVVGGGGGGGDGANAANNGGGGGAGSYVYEPTFFLTPGSYPIVIGNGGVRNGYGYNSTFDTIIAIGGGGGGASSNGLNGGSGGGGAGVGANKLGGAGTTWHGYYGATGGTYANGGGGGGGAIEVGDTDGGSLGGDGVVNPIPGSTTGQNISGTYYICGGGSGGNDAVRLAGGDGGGGTGAVYTDASGGGVGTANTGGGGGGGASRPDSVPGGIGGSGVVIISYITANFPTCTGGNITTSGANTIHTFLSNGTFFISGTKKTMGVTQANVKKVNKGYSGDKYTKLLIHLDGADAATAYTAETGQTVTFNGNSQLDTAQSKFGGSSVLLDGTGDYLSLPMSTNWNFGTGAFTVDFCFKANGFLRPNCLYSHGGSNAPTGSGGVVEHYTANKMIYYSTGFKITGTTEIIDGNWHHVALIGNGGANGARTIKLYLDGVQEGNTYTFDYNFLESNVVFGSNESALTAESVDGWMDEIRVSKGIQRWTGNFTPPTSPYNVVKKISGVSNL